MVYAGVRFRLEDVAATLALVPYAGWLYGCVAAALGAWFLVEAHRLKARVAAGDYRAALHILAPRSLNWSPPVITYSALTGDGNSGLWNQVMAHTEKMTGSGELAERRRDQQVKWMWTMLEERLTARLRGDSTVRAKLRQAEAEVAAGKLAPTLAVEEIAQLLGV